MNDLKPQLAPGWSGVNIALLVVLYLVFKPLALLMLAYILFGARLGLDLGRPETFGAAWRRLTAAFGAGTKHWGADPHAVEGSERGGTPAPAIDRARELEQQERALATEREALARERAAFEQEKKRTAQGD